MAGESAHFGLRQRPPMPAIRPFDLPPRLRGMLEQAKARLGEPFRGISAEGSGARPFLLHATGLPLTALIDAARALWAGLTSYQRAIACFAIEDAAWRTWSNIHPWLLRHGVCLADLGHDQRQAVLALMRHAMSAS